MHRLTRRLPWALAWALLAGCHASAGPDSAGGDAATLPVAEERMTLSLTEHNVLVPLGANLPPREPRRFVRVVVARVHNPRRIPVSFEIHHVAAGGQERRLGSFSLFPPDRPGSFLVPATGELRAGDAIRVSLVPRRAVASTATIRVELARVAVVGAEGD